MSSVKKTDHNTGITTLLENCVGSFKSPERVLRNWTNGLMSLPEKTLKSNHLQMLEQRHHHLNYLKTLSVGPAGNQTRASRTIDWHLTN